MSGTLSETWPVEVCFFAGSSRGDGETIKLANGIRTQAIATLSSAEADLDIRMADPVVDDINSLAAALEAGRFSILHVVAHGDTTGTIEVDDIWKLKTGELRLDREDLARLLTESGVRLVILSVCHGAVLAKHLVEAGAVDVAIGMDPEQDFNTALVFSKAFYRSLAMGRSLADAHVNGCKEAGLRSGEEVDALHLFARDDALRTLPVYARPDFLLLGNPTEKGAIAELIEALEPHIGFHVEYSLLDPDGPNYAGEDHARLMIRRFEQAKIVMLLFEGERQEDSMIAELVARAVDKAARGKVRMFPVYLKGTRPNRNVPFGMMRVVPAYLERFDGDYDRMGKWLAKLIR